VSSSKSDLLDLTLQLHAETPKALLVSDDGVQKNAVWLPLSQIEYEKKPGSGLVVVTLPEWLALDKGLV
jgi:hypothetical protein